MIFVVLQPCLLLVFWDNGTLVEDKIAEVDNADPPRPRRERERERASEREREILKHSY